MCEAANHIIINTMERNVYLVRHGETEWNKEVRIQGNKDIPLFEEGRVKVEELAETLIDIGISRIATSPLLRALESAEIISKRLGGIPMEIREGLRERNLGELEGLLVDEVKAIHGEDWQLITPPMGEPQDEFKIRIVNEFEEVVKQYPNENLLFVCHGWVIGVLDSHLAPDSKERRDGYAVKNSTLYTYPIITESGKPTNI